MSDDGGIQWWDTVGYQEWLADEEAQKEYLKYLEEQENVK